MNYDDCINLIDFLTKRFREGGLNTSWDKWGVDITWDKLKRWGKLLGYKGSMK